MLIEAIAQEGDFDAVLELFDGELGCRGSSFIVGRADSGTYRRHALMWKLDKPAMTAREAYLACIRKIRDADLKNALRVS